MQYYNPGRCPYKHLSNLVTFIIQIVRWRGRPSGNQAVLDKAPPVGWRRRLEFPATSAAASCTHPSRIAQTQSTPSAHLLPQLQYFCSAHCRSLPSIYSPSVASQRSRTIVCDVHLCTTCLTTFSRVSLQLATSWHRSICPHSCSLL